MISLITLTTVPGSAQRFEKLCSILGDGIIGSIWLYGSRDLETIEATLEVLPQLIGALGIATTRFLKVSSRRCGRCQFHSLTLYCLTS